MPSRGALPNVADGQRTPGSWASASSFEDIDAQAAHFRGYGQHYEQLSAGPFRGSFASYQFGGRLSVHLEFANRKLMQAASTPAGRCGFSVVAPGSPPCVLNGHVVRDGDIIVYPAGTTIEGTTPEGMRIYCVDIDAAHLAAVGVETHEIRVARQADRAGELHDVLASGIDAFVRLGSPADFGAAAVDFCSTVASLVWQRSDCDARTPLRMGRQGIRLAFTVYHRAREVMIDRLADGVSITEICSSIGVSRRSLECAFQTAVGMGPAQYVRKLQLNQVRRDLLRGANPDCSIGVIAARHGVWHWSRFSQSYRAMFGELPSQTRARGRAHEPP